MTITSMAGKVFEATDDEVSLAYEAIETEEEVRRGSIEKDNIKITAMWQVASLSPETYMPKAVALRLKESAESATEAVQEEVATEVSEETVATTEVEEVTELEVEETEETIAEEVPEETEYVWDGPVLNSYVGTVEGPSGKETYYNLPMSYVVELMHNAGFEGEYWVRDDGVKMFGDYVMVAADLSHRPKGTILPTSLGMGIVCDTGGFVKWNSYQIDIAVAW